ncbi:MAG: glycoside hydrolase family 16 protein [Spirochaetes bacterium]|nr:glycoside hydrolase family 16 protein [Spirochaetota bacterium]
MHPFRLLSAIVLLSSCLLPEGKPLFPGATESVWVKSGEGIEWVASADGGAPVLRVKVPERRKSAWDVQVEARAPGEVPKGWVEISLSVRALKTDSEGGLCTVGLKLLTRPQNDGIGRWEARAGKNWTSFRFLCPLERDFPADTLALAVMFAGAAQDLEVSGLSVIWLSETESAQRREEARKKLDEEVRLRPRIAGLPAVSNGQHWELRFQDEFSGDKLDETKWKVREGARHDAMRTARAVTVENGALRMGIFREGDKVYNSWVDTEGLFSQTYGYFCARMKMHGSTGHWNAFWLQAKTVGNVDGSGRDGTEIDIMEKPWLTDEVNHALHWDGYGKDHQSSGIRSTTPGVMTGYHNFSLLWTPTEYVFFVDEAEVWRTHAGGVCQVPVHLRITDEAQASEKSWAGDVRKAKLPDAWYVDWVRVYSLVDGKGKEVMKP